MTRPLMPVIPVIIPMTLYHGESKWELETSFGSLFDSPEYLKRYVPDFEYNLNDISHVPDDEIKGTIRLRVLCLTLKYIFSPGYRKYLKRKRFPDW